MLFKSISWRLFCTTLLNKKLKRRFFVLLVYPFNGWMKGQLKQHKRKSWKKWRSTLTTEIFSFSESPPLPFFIFRTFFLLLGRALPPPPLPVIFFVSSTFVSIASIVVLPFVIALACSVADFSWMASIVAFFDTPFSLVSILAVARLPASADLLDFDVTFFLPVSSISITCSSSYASSLCVSTEDDCYLLCVLYKSCNISLFY